MSELRRILARNIVYPADANELLKAEISGITSEKLEAILSRNLLMQDDAGKIRTLLRQYNLSAMYLGLLLQKLDKKKKAARPTPSGPAPFGLPAPSGPAPCKSKCDGVEKCINEIIDLYAILNIDPSAELSRI